MNYRGILVILLGLLLSGKALSQGCSDAGFCTMGAMKPDQAYSKKINFKLRSIELSYYKGNTTLSPVVNVANLDVSLGIGKKTGVQVKLPFQWTRGNFGKAAGIGDISLSVTHNLGHFRTFEFNATFGMKIPSNDANLRSQGRNEPGTEGLALPMYYQVSLGSWDIIAGASLINENWLLAIGYQNALTANGNTYSGDEWAPIYSGGEAYVREYDEATLLKRGSDVMMRIERNFRFARYNFNIGLLPIFRVSKDQIIDKATNEYVKLEGTTGLAASALVGFGYNFNINNAVKFTYGVKLRQREVNPDGLTRTTVMIIGYLFRF